MVRVVVHRDREVEGQVHGGVRNPIRGQRELAVRGDEGQGLVSVESRESYAGVKGGVLQDRRVPQGEQHLRNAAQLAVDQNFSADAPGNHVSGAVANAADRLDNVDVHLVGAICHILPPPPHLGGSSADVAMRQASQGRGQSAEGACLASSLQGHVGEHLGAAAGNRLDHLADGRGRRDDGLQSVHLRGERQPAVNHLVQKQIHRGEVLAKRILADLSQVSQEHLVDAIQKLKYSQRGLLVGHHSKEEHLVAQDMDEHMLSVGAVDRRQGVGELLTTELLDQRLANYARRVPAEMPFNDVIPRGGDYEEAVDHHSAWKKRQIPAPVGL
mmetsp:Transcript_125248/g.297253  ORF Transcript_125248/g.297253 Transcript_125248/m.297253 type:complete len:328 (+) Transcript_125248:533-1516(+)